MEPLRSDSPLVQRLAAEEGTAAVGKERVMELPDWLHGRVVEILATEAETAARRNHWAVILGLVPKLDGDQWCILWGENLQEGVAAFGSTPVAALQAFDQAMIATNQPGLRSDGRAAHRPRARHAD